MVLVAPAFAGTPDWTLPGPAASAAVAGDLDGDGLDDLVVGTGATLGPAVFLYPGSAAGPAAIATWSASAGQPGASLGAGVASAGDVDGDGSRDLVVTATGWDAAGTDEGAVLLFRGGVGGPSAVWDWMATSGQAGARLGTNLSTAGDLDGDGHSDVLAGALSWSDGLSDSEGAVFAWLGAPGLPSTAPDWSAQGGDEGAGMSAVAAGDVDGDGYDDVVAGAYALDWMGVVLLYRGSTAGPSAAPDWRADLGGPFTYLGFAVAAGDLDGDGFDDVVGGAYQWTDGEPSEGAVAAWLGSSTGPSATEDWLADGDQSGAFLGLGVACGDVNADGYADVYAAATKWDDGEADEGAALLYLGSPVGPGRAPDRTDASDQAGAEAGYPLALGGDLDGDGFGDRAVAAHSWDGATADQGATFVFRGFATDGDGDGLFTPEDCDDFEDDLPRSFHADADGDGFGDPASEVLACDGPDGTVTDGTDCDDRDDAVHPGAAEACNGLDDDCDGTVDGPECDEGPTTTGEPTDPAPDERRPADEGGCGCAGAPGPGWLALAALGVLRRRARPGRRLASHNFSLATEARNARG